MIRAALAGPLLVTAAARAADVPAASTLPPDLAKVAAAAEAELHGNILPFWLKHARRADGVGFNAFIGEDMVVRNELPFGALLTCRILWTFSAAYRQRPDPAYLEMARFAYHDLTTRFIDREHGGVYWSLDHAGNPVARHKQVYLQAFAIYGLAEYFRATGDPTALKEAQAVYTLLEQHAYDKKWGGYFDVLDEQWARVSGGTGNVLGDAPKSQNSHIHVLEAFTNLLRVWPDPQLRQRHRELVTVLLDHIIDPRTHHLILFLRDDWTRIGEEVSYGHDIELSWLLVEAAEVAGDAGLLARSRREATAIADATLAEGIDSDGGVFLEGDHRGPTDFNKEWWEQAEAVVGFANAYTISPAERYSRQACLTWDFIQTHMVDRAQGDWHTMLRRDGSVILASTGRTGHTLPTAKLSVWKCPYHNSRMCLELIARSAPATKD